MCPNFLLLCILIIIISLINKINFKLEFRVRNVGSAVLGLAYVAKGTIDGFQIDNLKPWDVAAGILLVREAGGTVIDTKGNFC